MPSAAKVLQRYREEEGREVYVHCKVVLWHSAYARYRERYSERQTAGLTDGDDIRLEGSSGEHEKTTQ